MDWCECGAPLAFSPDGVHCIGCYESLRTRLIDIETVARLVVRLEQERSQQACIELAEALGYTVQVEDEAVWLDHPLSGWMSLYFQPGLLVAELLETAEAVRRRAWCWFRACCACESEVMSMDSVVVGRGVDTLLLNVYYTDADGKPDKRDLAPFLVRQLNVWKNRAILEEKPVVVPWAFRDVHLHMYPHGAGRGQWTWLLTSDLLNLCLSRGRLNCIGMVRLSSEYLWSCPSLREAIEQVQRFLCECLETRVYLQVSEVHLCADVAWSFEHVEYQREFVSRSHKRTDYEVAEGEVEDYTYGLHRTGLAFSARGPMSCVIYDKTREVKRSGKLWFEDLWSSNGWDGTGPVWRIEFRFKRECLHELKVDGLYHGIEDVTDLPARLVDLWAYAAGHVGGGTDGWLRLIVPRADDTTRSRWPVHPVWEEVRAAFVRASSTPDDFHKVIRKCHEGWNTDRAIESTMGFATSLAAHVGGELAQPDADLSLFLRWLYEAGMDYLEVKQREFAQEVLRKRVEFGLQTVEL